MNEMIELTNTAVQTVAAGQSVIYNATAVKGGCAERHRAGSAQVVLTKPGRYLVGFSGNIAIPTGGTAGEISLALTYDGEPIAGSAMRITPAAVEQYGNVSTQHYVDVYCNCCVTVSVQNTSGVAILVESPNITAVRVCGG
nr:MAG TPA: hypothetical protein [Caudoviricetes sp.]